MTLTAFKNGQYRLSSLKRMGEFYEFFEIIDRFEMTKNQNVTFKRDLPKEAILWKLMKIKLPRFSIILSPMH